MFSASIPQLCRPGSLSGHREGMQMDDKTRGAWVIHHADKVRQVKEPGTFENILVAGKGATVLSAIAATDEAELAVDRVRTLAKSNGVNQLELESVLNRLEARHLIDRDGESVQVVGVTTASVSAHGQASR